MDPWQKLIEDLTRLKDSWPAPPWAWDSRFHAVMASFSKAAEPAVRASAVLAFPRGWTTNSIDDAPPTLRALADRTGGLRAGQRLLGGDPTTAALLYGLWWPWGNGETISLRIGLVDVDMQTEPFPQLLGVFGLKI